MKAETLLLGVVVGGGVIAGGLYFAKKTNPNNKSVPNPSGSSTPNKSGATVPNPSGAPAAGGGGGGGSGAPTPGGGGGAAPTTPTITAGEDMCHWLQVQTDAIAQINSLTSQLAAIVSGGHGNDVKGAAAKAIYDFGGRIGCFGPFCEGGRGVWIDVAQTYIMTGLLPPDGTDQSHNSEVTAIFGDFRKNYQNIQGEIASQKARLDTANQHINDYTAQGVYPPSSCSYGSSGSPDGTKSYTGGTAASKDAPPSTPPDPHTGALNIAPPPAAPVVSPTDRQRF